MTAEAYSPLTEAERNFVMNPHPDSPENEEELDFLGNAKDAVPELLAQPETETRPKVDEFIDRWYENLTPAEQLAFIQQLAQGAAASEGIAERLTTLWHDLSADERAETVDTLHRVLSSRLQYADSREQPALIEALNTFLPQLTGESVPEAAVENEGKEIAIEQLFHTWSTQPNIIEGNILLRQWQRGDSEEWNRLGAADQNLILDAITKTLNQLQANNPAFTKLIQPSLELIAPMRHNGSASPESKPAASESPQPEDVQPIGRRELII